MGQGMVEVCSTLRTILANFPWREPWAVDFLDMGIIPLRNALSVTQIL